MRTNTQNGGGLGNSYTFGAPIIPGIDAGQTVVPQSSCMATTPPGFIANPRMGAGLPGMGGGGRRRGTRRGRGRRGAGRSRRRQRGGRYSFDLTDSSIFGGTPYTSGIPQVMKIAPEGAVSNPLNPVQMGGVQTVDGAAYFAPTAGYSNTPSTWVGSTGTPSLLQTPYDARSYNPACLKTGGGRRKATRRRKGTKQRKGRK